MTGPEDGEAENEAVESGESDETRAIRRKARRKLAARRRGERGAWFGLGMFGLVGWAVAVPTVLGTALGLWIDARTGSERSWTLALLLAGVALGCLNAWFWIGREGRDD